ncbi:aldehyde dehydrogenase family protein, partial [Patescibacteria group bacterium]
ALGEVSAAMECGLFMAGEARRFHGQNLMTATPNRSAQLVRDSIGPGALLVPFNNPMASVAWKTFPALLCGNTVVLKSHEYTPYTAVWFAKLLKEAGLPHGVFSVLQGFGEDVGAPLVSNNKIEFVSFTGSSSTASSIIKATADRLAKVSIEAGGKNPIIVCDDADLESAVSIAVSSAFVDAGQRCAAASRIIIFDSIYEKFKEMFLEKVKNLKVGINDSDDFGAIISEKRLNEILGSIDGAVERGAVILSGGKRMDRAGYFISPTVLESVSPDDELSQNEIFGPVVVLYKARDFNEAIELANNSKYKLSGAIQTSNINRGQEFIKQYRAGVARVNGPTYGSEPHMPFGGLGLSGNGWREPGEKALDFYSEWKQISIDHDPNQL